MLVTLNHLLLHIIGLILSRRIKCLNSTNSDHVKYSFSCVFCSTSLYFKENSHLTDSATPEACCVKETPMQVIVFVCFSLQLDYQIRAFISLI